ncbi:GldG family protein [Paenibacillus urinalis]|uniref:GldG family protein n=1 Tax=Paenibacillus urinalis TaxID=521520 RepID=UPI0023687C97|nr:GldG family protein [Paenibacillus urinalis]WDH97916.1 GldG family protein [Paenibacillus urinalis]
MKKWLNHTNSAVISIAVTGIFILLTLFLNSLGGFQLDLTANKQNTLSEQTLETIKGVEEDVRMLVFTVNSSSDELLNREVQDIVDEYSKRNNKLKVEDYNLENEPILAQQYGLTASSIVLVQGDKQQVVPMIDLFTSGETEGSYLFSGEEKLTQALNSLSSDEVHRVALLTGHGELDLSLAASFQSSLNQSNVETEELSLADGEAVPEGTDVLAILGPQNDLTDSEMKQIQSYMDNGGKLLLTMAFHESMDTAWPNIDALAEQYGVHNEHAVMVDPEQSMSMGPLWSMPVFQSHAITDKLIEHNLTPVFSLTLGLSATEQDKWTVAPIVQSSESSYGETNVEGLLVNDTDNDAEADLKGPVDVGYAVSTPDGKPKAVILGATTFIQDSEFSTGGNRDFILNTINYLAEKENGVTIRPKEQAGYELAYLTLSQGTGIFVIAVILFPLLFVAAGILLWWRRRR